MKDFMFILCPKEISFSIVTKKPKEKLYFFGLEKMHKSFVGYIHALAKARKMNFFHPPRYLH